MTQAPSHFQGASTERAAMLFAMIAPCLEKCYFG
jgi:hypothetical protein